MRDGLAEKRLFEDCPVLRSVLALAVPTVISQIILVIYNMADTFFIGMTGSDAMLTSVAVCMPAFMFLSAISNLFGVGGAGVISRALGAGEAEKARSASVFAFWGCLAVTLAYSLAVWIWMDPFVDLLGGSAPAVHPGACRYLTWTVVLGGWATSLNALLGHLVRSEGRSAQAGFGIALGGLLNIALDPLFMFVLLPGGSEVTGAALATALSNLAAALYFLLVVLGNRKRSVLSLRPASNALRGEVPRQVLATGLPACLMTLCENISYAVLDNLMGLSGTAMQAGIGVAKKVNMLAHCMVRGMSQGVLPLIGYTYARGSHRRMRSAMRLSMGISVGLAGCCMAAGLLFPEGLIGVFIRHDSPSLIYGARFLQILCLGGPFSACAYAVISFFQAVGESGKSLLLALLRKGILDIPMMFMLARALPVYGIVWATPIADVLCCAAAAALFIRFFRRLKPSARPAVESLHPA
ncbi:MAG: hypothetical protein IJH38_00185 [Clostridia bacterium]|nr:hypothetical protein [Clostridia bacterium]